MNGLQVFPSSEELSGLGNFLLGIGTLVSASFAWAAARRAHGAKREATHAGASARAAQATSVGTRAVAEQVRSSVGEANGQTVLDLLHKFEKYEEYAHKRNHDVLGQLTLVTSGVPLLLDHASQQTLTMQHVADALNDLNERVALIEAAVVRGDDDGDR